MAHLITGSHEESYLAHVAMYAMCVGPNQELCEEDPTEPPGGTASVIVPSFVTMTLLVITHILCFL